MSEISKAVKITVFIYSKSSLYYNTIIPVEVASLEFLMTRM